MASKGKKSIDPMEFIKVWQTSSMLKEVCAKLKIKQRAARHRAHYYRRQGVKLKQLLDGRFADGVYDWEKLKKYAERFAL